MHWPWPSTSAQIPRELIRGVWATISAHNPNKIVFWFPNDHCFWLMSLPENAVWSVMQKNPTTTLLPASVKLCKSSLSTVPLCKVPLPGPRPVTTLCPFHQANGTIGTAWSTLGLQPRECELWSFYSCVHEQRRCSFCFI